MSKIKRDYKKELADARTKRDLDARMAKAVGQNVGPSMVPAPRQKRAVETEPLQSMDQLGFDKSKRDTLRVLVARQAELSAKIKATTAERDLINRSISNELGRGCKFMCEDYRVNYFSVSRRSIKDHLLRAQGVDQHIISMSTETSTSWQLRITRQGEED